MPIIANEGIGDVDEHIKKDISGTLIEDFSRESYIKANEQIKLLSKTTNLAEICRSSARKRFDLEKVGGERYRRLYEKLLIKSRI